MDETGVVVEEYTNLVGEHNEPSSTAPSSPPPHKHAILSSDAPDEGNDTPPSSPPPRLPSPLIAARKPTFTFLKRKRATATESCPRAAIGPLKDIINSIPGRERPAKKPRLTQMRIDLGGEIRTTCKICGMEYIPSNAQDAALHKEFHVANLGGVDVGKTFLKRYVSSVVWDSVKDATVEVGHAPGFVMVVSRRSSRAERNKVRRILKVVNMELSAVDIEDERLWSQMVLSKTTASAEEDNLNGAGPASARDEKTTSCGDRFKVYIFVSGEKCIGLCLAERISKAYEVESQNDDADTIKSNPGLSKSSSISVGPDAKPAILGISRIWTSVSHRRKGVAAALLDAARRNFIYGVQISKDMIAFSQPTESGGLLAQNWFEGAQRWHVYVER